MDIVRDGSGSMLRGVVWLVEFDSHNPGSGFVDVYSEDKEWSACPEYDHYLRWSASDVHGRAQFYQEGDLPDIPLVRDGDHDVISNRLASALQSAGLRGLALTEITEKGRPTGFWVYGCSGEAFFSKRLSVPEPNSCLFCGNHPVVCPHCGYVDELCSKCFNRTVTQDKSRPDGMYYFPSFGQEPIVECGLWDGSDCFRFQSFFGVTARTKHVLESIHAQGMDFHPLLLCIDSGKVTLARIKKEWEGMLPHQIWTPIKM